MACTVNVATRVRCVARVRPAWLLGRDDSLFSTYPGLAQTESAESRAEFPWMYFPVMHTKRVHLISVNVSVFM